MKARITYPKSFGKFSTTVFIGLFFSVALVLVGCGGGGGGESVEQLPSEQNVTISGKVDDGTENSPIANAFCRFVDTNNKVHALVASNENGEYSIVVPPGLAGHVRCSPADLPFLAIYTLSSTEGFTAGGAISEENVNPATTIVTDIIQWENPADPQTRKRELLELLANYSDAELALMVEAASMQYRAMLEHRFNVNFGGDGGGGGGNGDGGGGEGDGDGSGGSGVGGDAGEGAATSPIAKARCEFVVGDTLKEAKPLYSSALSDFLQHGRCKRPDLKNIADWVNSSLESHTFEQIQAAFAKFFPKGIGKPYFDITDDEGKYYIHIPPNVPGFVRCTPPEYEKAVLATYIPALIEGELRLEEEITPATTYFSNNINLQTNADIEVAKETFLSGFPKINANIVQDVTNGTYYCRPYGDAPLDQNTGLVAFAATSMFNACYQNGLDCDYLAGLDSLSKEKDITKVLVPGLTTEPTAASAAALLISSVQVIEQIPEQRPVVIPQFPTSLRLSDILSQATIKVTVTDQPGGTILNGAYVELNINNNPNITCVSTCTGTTQGGLPLTFKLKIAENDPNAGNAIVIKVSQVKGFDIVHATTSVSASITTDIEIPLKLPLEVKIDGTGAVTSSPIGIKCSYDNTDANCTANFTKDSKVTLTASASSGYYFSSWSGGCSSNSNPCIVTMDKVQTVTAAFKRIIRIEPIDPRFRLNLIPVIANPHLELVALNDKLCSLSLPLGSLFLVTFDYSDSNGNGPTNIAEARLNIAYDFPYGVDGGFRDYTWNSSLSGNGATGTAKTFQCYRFGKNEYVDLSINIQDKLGAVSQPLTVRIKKPLGAN
jgi:hypothetical protein